MAGNIRFMKNCQLDVEFNGQVSEVIFRFGDIYNVEKVEVDNNEEYCNVYFTDGSVLREIQYSLINTMTKKTTIVKVDKLVEDTIVDVEDEEENTVGPLEKEESLDE